MRPSEHNVVIWPQEKKPEIIQIGDVNQTVRIWKKKWEGIIGISEALSKSLILNVAYYIPYWLLERSDELFKPANSDRGIANEVNSLIKEDMSNAVLLSINKDEQDILVGIKKKKSFVCFTYITSQKTLKTNGFCFK